MSQIIGSKVIAGMGVSLAVAIGIDMQLLENKIGEILNVNPLFTNLYLTLFVIYYAIKIYWFWIDKALNKKEREKNLKD